MNDPNALSSWVDMFALVMQESILILRYKHANHLTGQGPFKVLNNYCTGKALCYLTRVFKVKTKPGFIKVKFVVQAPLGFKQAFFLDQLNGNTFWHNAIKKETIQFYKYRVFCTLNKGEPVPAGYNQIP